MREDMTGTDHRFLQESNSPFLTLNDCIGLPLKQPLFRDILSTQPQHLSIVDRAKDKGAPCWIQTNNLLTVNGVRLPTKP